MSCDGMRPDDLAGELGMSRKELRDWLRLRFPRTAAEHHTNWYLTHEQVEMARRRGGPTLGGIPGGRHSSAGREDGIAL